MSKRKETKTIVSVKVTFKINPEWKKQCALVKKELAKLSKMKAYTIISK